MTRKELKRIVSWIITQKSKYESKMIDNIKAQAEHLSECYGKSMNVVVRHLTDILIEKHIGYTLEDSQYSVITTVAYNIQKILPELEMRYERELRHGIPVVKKRREMEIDKK